MAYFLISLKRGRSQEKILDLSSASDTGISWKIVRFVMVSIIRLCGGGKVEWFEELDLKSGGPWFKFSTLLLSGFVLGSPAFNSSAAFCK